LAPERASGRKTFASNCKILWQRCYVDKAAEVWSIPVNWEKGPAIKEKRREMVICHVTVGIENI